jgi:hypothetical protein
MIKNQHLILHPLILQQNDVLSINSATGSFIDTEYIITNLEGRVLRKGMIISKMIELKLRIVGMTSGLYIFKMGEYQERFEIV